MLLIRGIHNLHEVHRGCVATIGNFDGVHNGHRAVFEALKQRAREQGLPSLVIIFERQPMEYFRPEQAPARLTRLREKLALIEEAGIDRLLLLRFGPTLAAMPADEFVSRVLIDGLAVEHLYVGDDFRFGRGREGDFDLLTRMGADHGFGVESLDTHCHDESRVSSTRIRDALARGDLVEAEHCLGRPFRMCGRVAHGHKLGRTIGFPTLNVELHRILSPVQGVFAVWVEGLGDGRLPGVASIGNRPVLENDDHYLLEVHLLDFDRQVYGAHIGVTFAQYIRPERKFDSFEELRAQIQRDADQAREYFYSESMRKPGAFSPLGRGLGRGG